MRQSGAAIQICTLRFPDGGRVEAQIHADSPYQDAPVQYAGAVDRMPVTLQSSSSVLLRALFHSLAREYGANFHEEVIGAWDRYADDMESVGQASREASADQNDSRPNGVTRSP